MFKNMLLGNQNNLFFSKDISVLVWFWFWFLFFFPISGLVLTFEDFLVVTIKEKCTAVDSLIVDFLGIM